MIHHKGRFPCNLNTYYNNMIIFYVFYMSKFHLSWLMINSFFKRNCCLYRILLINADILVFSTRAPWHSFLKYSLIFTTIAIVIWLINYVFRLFRVFVDVIQFRCNYYIPNYSIFFYIQRYSFCVTHAQIISHAANGFSNYICIWYMCRFQLLWP